MKNIKDLKEDILNKTAGNLFVFDGFEWAIKKHYIEKISEDYKSVKYVNDTVELSASVSTKSLFKKKTLYVVPHDLDFLKATGKEIDELIRKIQAGDNGVIWVYSVDKNKEGQCGLPKTFLTHFDKFITEFDEVEEDIFKELIEHDINLLPKNVKILCKNCKRNYGMALMEIDKIKNYAEKEQVSNDIAFEDLYNNKMLNIEKDKFDCTYFMNCLLVGDWDGISKCLKCLYDSDFKDSWYHLEEIVQDLKIAYCIKKYGYYEGSSIAYNSRRLFWGRIKEIRDLGGKDKHGRPIVAIMWDCETIQRLILNLSRYDSLVKTGAISEKEVIENIFYYLI